MSITINNDTLTQLLIRRGTDATRKTVVLSQGELGFTTDTQRLFAGDGLTTGGVSIASKFLSNSASIATLSASAQLNDFTYDPVLNNIYLYTSSGFQVAGPTYIAGSGFISNTNIFQLDSQYWSINSNSVVFGALSASTASLLNNKLNVNGRLAINGSNTQQLVLSSGTANSILSTNGQLIINTGLLHQYNPTTVSTYDLQINGSTYVNGTLSAFSSSIISSTSNTTTANTLSSLTLTYISQPNLSIQSGNRVGNLTQPYVNLQYSSGVSSWNTGLYITAQPFCGVNVTDTYLQSIGTNTSSINFAVSGNSLFTNTVRVSGDVIANFAASDINLKSNIKPIIGALDKVMQLNGVHFNWVNNAPFAGKSIGVIAQEVEQILPEIVETRSDGFKGVDYIKLIPLLIEAIKELNNKNK